MISAGDRKIRVLFLVDQIHGATAGTEQHISFLMHNLPVNQYEIHLTLIRDVGYYNSAVFPTKPVILNGKSSGSKFEVVGSARKLSHLISDRKVDLIHTFFPDSELVAIIASRLVRPFAFLASRRNMGFRHTCKSLWRTRFTNQFIPYFLANCQAVKEQLGRLEWIPNKKFEVIPNPVNRKRIEEGLCQPLLKQDFSIKNGELVVGIVANITPVKDHETFLRAARIILQRLPRTKFIIVGDEEQETRRRLESVISDLGLRSVISFVGGYDNPVRLLKMFDVGVLCSKSEGLSNSLIEYAAVGLPAVATDVGGNPEVVIHGKTGFLVPPSSPESLAEYILELLTNDDLRKTYGENAKKMVTERFDQDMVISAYEKFYRKIIHCR